jgi:hypothetical protein
MAKQPGQKNFKKIYKERKKEKQKTAKPTQHATISLCRYHHQDTFG